MTARVAYICGEYPRATDTFIQREVLELRRAGIHVEMISVRRPAVSEQGTQEQREERERTHYLLPCSPGRLAVDHLGLLVRSPLRYLRGLWMALSIRSPGLASLIYQMFYFAEAGMVAAYLRRRGLVHLHNHAPGPAGYVTMLGAHLAQVTYSMTLHGFGILSEPARWRLKEKLERSLFTICVSHNARSQAMLWTDVECWGRYHIVHCGVVPGQYEQRPHTDPGRSILFVGRFDRVKGLPVLLDAFAVLARKHPDVRLDLVGDGPARQKLEAMATAMGLAEHVRFHGYRSSTQLSAHRSEADVMVLSSFAEGVPVVLMEALASGLPVVAPHVAGVPELVEDGVNGFLVPAGDVDSLANRVSHLLSNPDLRSRFGEAGRRKVEQEFNLENEVARLAAIFQENLGVTVPHNGAQAKSPYGAVLRAQSEASPPPGPKTITTGLG